MDVLRALSLFGALLTSGVMAGLYFAFSTSVPPGIGRRDDNNRLDSTEPPEAAHVVFEERWVRWNAVRTVVCTLSLAAFVVALVS